MIIIADSGSTNTNWAILKNKEIFTTFNTVGFNPYFTTSNKIVKELESSIPSHIPKNKITTIYFYGAGCANPEKNKTISDALSGIFTNSDIHIHSDILAAARALFFNKNGIAAILGTGASTCYYDGIKITESIMPLGYILGNEGGGDYLGKLFITDFLNNELPKTIHQKFIEKYQVNKSEILHSVYNKPYPNRYLASFCSFISANAKTEYIHNLITKSFTDFFRKNICKYDNYKKLNIRFTGGVAHYFTNELEEVALTFDLTIGLIEKDPMKRLVQYHLENM